MRLALLLYRYFPYGGVQQAFRGIARELLARGHHCRVYCLSWQGEPLAGADVRLVPTSAYSRHRSSERFIEWVRTDLASQPVDGVIGFHNMPGLDICFAPSSCFLDRAQLRGRLYRRSAHFRHFAACERAVFAVDSATHVLLRTEVQRDTLLQHYPTPATRLHLLPAGVSIERRLPEDAPQRRKTLRAQLGLEGQELALLCVGSRFEEQGLDRAITAYARLRTEQPSVKARLLVAGQGKLRTFRRVARKLGVADGVVFLGGREDVVDLMLGADLLVHPARSAAVGTVLLEALAAGLPVVATEVCGYASHIKAGRAGILLPSPFSQPQLDQAVMRFIDGVFRADCRSGAQLYARLTDLFSMHSACAQRVEQLIHTASRE
jgi:UDP-glucose:(heptosyl)LPS alpha-1,3-glucosyltransferase